MLRAIPTGWFSTKYELFENDEAIGLIEFEFASESAFLTVSGKSYKAGREGWMSGPFLLESQGSGIIARAEKPDAFQRRFELAFAGGAYTLAAESVFFRKFVLLDGESIVGSIDPDHLFTSRSTIDMPASFPLPIQAFIFWLTALLWKRDASAAATTAAIASS